MLFLTNALLNTEMSQIVGLSVVIASIFISEFRSCNADKILSEIDCPLWHIRHKGICKCSIETKEFVTCTNDQKLIIGYGFCMTWNNTTHKAVLNRCPFTYQFSKLICPPQSYKDTINQIPTNISGPDLNRLTCKKFDRQGTQCRECRDGYGPAAFSDGFSCADCSKHRHLWILHLFLQLTMVTLMYLVVILFQIKGTSSPLNVIITYSQLSICPIMVSVHVHLKLICYINPTFATILLSFVGVSNLDFFHFLVPPLCISTSLKSINTFLFNYIIAFYPLILTVLLYLGIELHDRNCWIITFLSLPLRKFLSLAHRRWNPKTTILNTGVTFVLLAYSKLLFASINLLFGIQYSNANGEVVPESTVLFYDPSIRFFHSEHIPYAVLALSVIVTFVLLPPLLLLLYPTRLFRTCLNWCGFRRWDILHLIADVFQGWYKDGTEGTPDYRALSALYMLMRVAFGGIFVSLIVHWHNGNLTLCVVGVFHVFLGSFFLITKPYKKNWMNNSDGLFLGLVGVVLLMLMYDGKIVLIFVAAVVTMGICLRIIVSCINICKI